MSAPFIITFVCFNGTMVRIPIPSELVRECYSKLYDRGLRGIELDRSIVAAMPDRLAVRLVADAPTDATRH
jgi:hypothetical protein